MRIEFVTTDQLSETQKESLKRLRNAMYPNAMLATTINKQFVHVSPQWSVLVWDEDEWSHEWDCLRVRSSATTR